jgi:hypothetical protein
MKNTLLLLALIVALAAAAGPTDAACDRAEYMLFHRHLNTTWLDSAYALLGSAHTADPRHERCLYLWSRVQCQKGDDARTDAEKLRFYVKGKAIAETLIAVNDRNPDGHCWWGVNQGRIGLVKGVLNSLFMVPSLKKAFNRTLELDPAYPTAFDALGVLYYELPGFAGGSLAKSESNYLAGLRSDPNYTLLRLDLAKVYIKQKRWLGARTQLNAIIDTKNPRYPADTELDDKPEAKVLLRKIESKQ